MFLLSQILDNGMVSTLKHWNEIKMFAAALALLFILRDDKLPSLPLYFVLPLSLKIWFPTNCPVSD